MPPTRIGVLSRSANFSQKAAPNPLPERGRFHRAAQIIDCLGNAELSALRSAILDYHLLSCRIQCYDYSGENVYIIYLPLVSTTCYMYSPE